MKQDRSDWRFPTSQDVLARWMSTMNTFAYRAVAWLVIGWLGVAGSAQAAILTVGTPGTGCNHTSVQDAVNAAEASPGADTIRISRITWTAQAININTNQELTLVGGFDNCADTTAGSPFTTLSGAGGAQAPVISFRGNGFFFVRNLIITEGDNLAGAGNGGGIFFQGGNFLDIRNAAITDNRARNGAGIYTDGTAITSEVLVGEKVSIVGNIAERDGGGILAGGLEFTLEGDNTILLNNEARGVDNDTGYGGGAVVISRDNFEAFLYVTARGIGGLGAIHGNVAKRGGGIAVMAGIGSGRDAEVQVYSTSSTGPVVLSANRATSGGGGVYVRPAADANDSSASARADLWYTSLIDNEAPEGAALYLANQETEILGPSSRIKWNSSSRPPGAVDCPTGRDCGEMRGNRTTAPQGGIVRIDDRDYAPIAVVANRLRIENNSAARLIEGGTKAWVSIGNSLIVENAFDDKLAVLATGGQASFAEVTVANNQIGSPYVLEVQRRLTLERSIFFEPGRATVAPGGVEVGVEYLLTNDPANMPAGLAAFASPRFVDPARGDYRLRAGSRGVDFADCNGGACGNDLFGRPRTVDVPIAGAGAGSPTRIADVGAFERQTLLPLVLNADFNADLNLWQALPLDSNWDGTQNAVGPAGSGSARVVYQITPKSLADAKAGLAKVPGRSQCIHLPGPGRYALNGFGRVLPASSPINPTSARLTYALRYNGGRFTCENGPAQVTSTFTLATTGAWNRPANPAVINVPAALWTQDTSVTISLDVTGGAIGTTTGWFDGITLEPLDIDELFENGFE
jgi:hypothetical protein